MNDQTADEACYGGCYVWLRIIFNIVASLGNHGQLRHTLRDTAYAVKANERWDAAVNIASVRASRHGLSVYYERARRDCEKICLTAGMDIGATTVLMDAAGAMSVSHLLDGATLNPINEYLSRLAVLVSAYTEHDGHSPCGDLACLSCYHRAVRIIFLNSSNADSIRAANSYVGFVPSLAITMMFKRLTTSR